MKLKYTAGFYNSVPKYYGLAYTDISKAQNIYYLIPLNIFIGLFRNFYWLLARGIKEPKFINEIRKESYKEGYQIGYSEAKLGG